MEAQGGLQVVQDAHSQSSSSCLFRVSNIMLMFCVLQNVRTKVGIWRSVSPKEYNLPKEPKVTKKKRKGILRFNAVHTSVARQKI